MKNLLKIIIIIHGSKSRYWKVKFIKLLKFIKKKFFFYKFSISYINNIKSNILKKINKFIKLKYKSYLILPIFISEGYHIKTEIPKLIKNILYIYIKIKIFISKNINKYKNFYNIIKKFCKIKIKKFIKIE